MTKNTNKMGSKLKIAGLCLAIGLVSGCATKPIMTNDYDPDVDESEPAEEKDMLAALFTKGLLPRMDVSASLPGPDKNGNGIRDDVDMFIATHKKSGDASHRAIVRVSRAYRMILASSLESDDELKSMFELLADGMTCLLKEKPEVKVMNDWVSWIDVLAMFHGNTPARQSHIETFLNLSDQLNFEMPAKAGVDC